MVHDIKHESSDDGRMEFIVTVKETLERRYIVRAEDSIEASCIIDAAYSDEQIILTADDYTDTDISVEEYDGKECGIPRWEGEDRE